MWKGGSAAGFLALTLVAGLLLVGAEAAATEGVFHLQLMRSAPAADTVLGEPPSVVRLWFTQAPQLAGTSVRIVGPGGELVEMGPVEPVGEHKTGVVTAVKGPVPAGRSRVVWRALARDGHVVRGEIPFTLRPASPAP